ncbi:MAG: selenocysteine-specific translation elongation factor [Deltaproteobacteria bacterium]|nr:selenocysteine-specific translation elongation factor [Deltaproteobacteria bacterium]
MHCTLGTAGHIDHGKTSLVKALTGIDTARLPEEKERGLTIDLGFANLEYPCSEGLLEGLTLAIVDVPGHERFIRNMLAGATGIDMALFAVAGDDGIMPQTIEHLDIVRLLGIESVIFAITKSDMVTRERLDRVKKDILALVLRTSLKGSPIAIVSSVTGEGVEGLKGLLLEKAKKALGKKQGVFQRLPVDRSFAIKGFGTVVTGTVASGVFKIGDEPSIFPSGLKTRVRGIESHYNKAQAVTRGQRAALNIAGVERGDIKRGDVIASADIVGFARSAPRVFDVSVEFLPCAIETLKRKNRVRLFHLTSEAEVGIEIFGSKDKDCRAYARVVAKEPLLMLRHDYFILRDTSANRTIGGGRVLIPHFSRATLSKPSDIVWHTLENDSLCEVISAILKPKEAGIEKKLLSYTLNVPEGVIEGAPGLLMLGKWAVPLKRFDMVKALIVEKISAYHKDHASESGVLPALVLGALKTKVILTDGLFDAIIERLCVQGAIRKQGMRLFLSGHMAGLSGEERIIEERLLSLLAKDYEPTGGECLNGLPFKKEDTMKVLSYLIRNGKVVKLKEHRFLGAEVLNTARDMLVQEIRKKGRIKAGEFRDLIGCGRRLAIEILEYFDREKITLRQGDYRTLRQG